MTTNRRPIKYTLLYCLGGEADNILASTNITDADRKKYNEVEEYIKELYILIEVCKYGSLKEEMLRDRLVVGSRDVGEAADIPRSDAREGENYDQAERDCKRSSSRIARWRCRSPRVQDWQR